MIGSEVGWHGGKVHPAAKGTSPRWRELELPSWTAIQKADLLSRWAFNQMLIGVATRKYARSVSPAGRRPGRPGQARHDEVLRIAAGSAWR